MTDEFPPITPPPELVEQWYVTADNASEDVIVGVANRAAQWGADQELKACCEWTTVWISAPEASQLRAARRPKPPRLKEQALAELDELLAAVKQLGIFNPPKNIRRALEQLND
tara:strand:- start:355 stop:693 length:339 start_codon:yes stop_codon:yes gene_type:complete